MNNSGRYFTCGVCHLENIVTKLCKKATIGHEILVIFLKYGNLHTQFPSEFSIVSLSTETET